MKVCCVPGCPTLIPKGTSRCSEHERPAWEGSTRRERLPPDWDRRRRRVLLRDGHRCYLCGEVASEVDHVEHGDDHSLENLKAICSPCHLKKSAREGRAARGG